MIDDFNSFGFFGTPCMVYKLYACICGHTNLNASVSKMVNSTCCFTLCISICLTLFILVLQQRKLLFDTNKISLKFTHTLFNNFLFVVVVLVNWGNLNSSLRFGTSAPQFEQILQALPTIFEQFGHIFSRHVF